MAQRGGKRPGAGRPVGSKDKATLAAKQTLSELAKVYAPEALDALARIMRDDQQSGSAVVAAANAILDRAYGKPFAAEPERDDDTPATSWVLEVRPAKGPVRVTKSE